MGRREFLRNVLLTATVGLSGCNVLQGSSDTTNGAYQLTTYDHIILAVGKLNTVALAVKEFQETKDPQKSSFDATKPKERMTTARNAIEKASKMAEGPDQKKDVKAVRTYADAMEGTVTSVDKLEQASDGLVQAKNILQAEDVDTKKADATLTDATAASETAVSTHSTASNALESANADRLKRLGAEYEAMLEGLNTLGGFVIGVDGLTTGYSTQVTGISHLQTAQDRVDADKYSGAKKSFKAAKETLAKAASEFSEVIPDAAESLVSDLEYGNKQSRSLNRLSAGYVSMLIGREHVSAAETKIENEAFDTARDLLTKGSDDAKKALKRFQSGSKILGDEFAEKFKSATDRATAMRSLAKGYTQILDARDHVTTAESKIKVDEFDAARKALTAATSDSKAANQTFASGQDLGVELFASKFETARNRATATTSLADGYIKILHAREHISTAETQIDEDEFEKARDSLDAASADSKAADQTFASGQKTADNFFKTQFETGRNRAQAISSLTSGYRKLLDARDHIETADSHIDADEYDKARASFQASSDDAKKADAKFASGQQASGSLFKSEFQTARGRATAVQSLSDGYVTLLDARDKLDEGESAFLDEEYSTATESFENAAEKSRNAQKTFRSGQEAEGSDIFGEEFKRANNRSQAIEALSSGYATMVSGRQEAAKGRTLLENQKFDEAAAKFETAGNTLGDAETTFTEGKKTSAGQFTTEFERALCQVGHLQNAVTHFKLAANAGSNGNKSTADSQKKKGESDLDRVDDC